MILEFLKLTRKKVLILRIDHAAMQWIRTLVEPVQGMVQRWLQTLANNEFDVVHRLGRNHGNADALSRAPHLIEDPSLELDISMGEKIGAVICSLQAEEAWTLWCTFSAPLVATRSADETVCQARSQASCKLLTAK
jgi:hypothetical protein